MKMRLRSEWRESQGGFLVLIELLIVVVIIAALASYFWTGGSSVSGGRTVTGGPGGQGGATSIPGKARERAESVVCRNNLSQIRAAIQTHQATMGSYPSGLESLDTSGLPLNCPDSGEAYQYDPSTGQVSCPTHPGY